jgi:hypothetical protein
MGPKPVYICGQPTPFNADSIAGTALPVAVDKNGILIAGPPGTVTNDGDTLNQASLIELNTDTVPATDFGVTTAGMGYSFNATTGFWERIESASAAADALVPATVGNQLVIAQLFGYNGATFDRIRVANIFHTVLATLVGSTAVWTPTAGKKFRLMGYTISVAGTLAATGVQVLKLEDAAVVIKTHLANVIETPTVSISGGDTQIGADLGQGQLSAAVNNVLNINLGTAMATGGVAVNVWGTEE